MTFRKTADLQYNYMHYSLYSIQLGGRIFILKRSLLMNCYSIFSKKHLRQAGVENRLPSACCYFFLAPLFLGLPYFNIIFSLCVTFLLVFMFLASF